jgi:hypothetical protein
MARRSQDGETQPSSFRSTPMKRLSIFTTNDDNVDDEEIDVNLLKSPKLKREILRKDRKIFSPVKSMNKLRHSLTKSRHGESKKASRGDVDASSDEDDSSSSDSSETAGHKLTEEEMMVLLCREFQLMDDDED